MDSCILRFVLVTDLANSYIGFTNPSLKQFLSNVLSRFIFSSKWQKDWIFIYFIYVMTSAISSISFLIVILSSKALLFMLFSGSLTTSYRFLQSRPLNFDSPICSWRSFLGDSSRYSISRFALLLPLFTISLLAINIWCMQSA